MLLGIIIGLLALDAIVLIILILLQPRGQGAFGSAFGTSSYVSQIFGGRGGLDFLTKLTAVLSVVFVVLILALNFYIGSSQGTGSVQQRATTPASSSVPVEPTELPETPTGE